MPEVFSGGIAREKGTVGAVPKTCPDREPGFVSGMGYQQIAKITRPGVQGIVERRQAFSLLDEACKKPVVWLSAPAGGGKTTLVASYLESREFLCLWYQVDERDSDMASFFYYLRLAAEANFSGHIGLPPLPPPEYAGVPATFAMHYFEQLFSAVPAAAEKPGFLVLDNFQQLPDDDFFHKALAGALDLVPSGVHVIIISRRAPSAQYARLSANNRMSVAGWDDIRFTLPETREFIRMFVASPSRLETGFVHIQDRSESGKPDTEGGGMLPELFHAAARGWPAGLVLLAEGFNRGKTTLPLLRDNHPIEEIADYFAWEICRDIDPSMLDFLVRTSFLPEMTPETASLVSGRTDAGRILSGLNRRNCFTEKRALQPPVYQYHPLFRTFLQVRAEGRFSRREIQDLQAAAARGLLKAGATGDAVELLLAAEQFGAAADQITALAPGMLAAGRGAALGAWLLRLPDSMFEERPWLLYWQGVCRGASGPGRALVSFRSAFARFTDLGDDAGALSAWSGAVSAILMEGGDFLQLDRWMEWMDRYMEKAVFFPSEEIESSVLTAILGILLFRTPRHPRAAEWIARADAIARAHPGTENGLLSCYLGMYYLVTGDISKAGVLAGKLAPFITKFPRPILRVRWYFIMAMHAHMATGSGEEAIRLAREGLSAAKDTGVHVFDLYLLAQGVHGGLALYDLRKTEKFLRAMSGALNEGSLWDVSNYHFLCSWKALCENNPRESREQILLALHLVDAIGCTFSRAVGHVGMAWAAAEMNRPETAERHIETAEGIVPGEGGMFEFMYLLARAHVRFRCSDNANGNMLLGRAMALGRRRGYYTAPFWQREIMGSLYARALETGIETDYVHDVIYRRNLRPPAGTEKPMLLESWPYPLRIYTMGTFAVYVNGRRISMPGKSQKKALGLLSILIARGRKDIPVEGVIDELYPETDGDRAFYAFKYTLHQLRKNLGSAGKFLLLEGGLLCLDESDCYTDYDAFLHSAAAVEKKWLHHRETIAEGPAGEEHAEMIAGLCRGVLVLYGGDFLTGSSLDSVAVARNRARHKFIRLVHLAGGCLEKTGRLSDAVEIYEEALEKSEPQEHFYRRLMCCYRDCGRMAEAVSIYERCCSVLKARLGAKPSEETMAVYQSLR